MTGIPQQQPAEWLEGTPFASDFIPGILLAGGVAGTAAMATWTSVRRADNWPLWTVLCGAVLIGWIAAEVALLNQPTAPTTLEIAYFSIGWALAIAGLATHGHRAALEPTSSPSRIDP